MSVNSVSGTSLQRDLAGALRLTRAAAVQEVDSSTFTPPSQNAGSTQGTGSASQPGTAASTPALSNDLMASLLQLQSDFSQMGLQNGVAVPADGSSGGKVSATGDGTDASQGADGTAPVRHHRHHARASAADATDATQAGQSGSATDVTATSASASTTATTSVNDLGDGLQSFLQQITKAIAAYASGGPAGIAAAALTSPSKA
ncbi:cell wall anchor protein [Methylobacterium mesophilicum SR1.6/6]|uniref:Cell wall anchor protein n=2 Tax=Methylobacterium mesophilicum TaxID=39956 RepID=A0A6B9FJZ9_9HYPH|nr:cell wall anchor protein [Methylobacterium mesophilicum SR1.6/6]